MDKHPLDLAAEIVGGSQATLAAALGVTKSAVNQWKTEGRQVPAEHCPEIERLTEGAVRCEQLRPDVSWDVLREPPAKTDRAAARDTPLHSQAEADIAIRALKAARRNDHPR
jgi:DNA-binding transcriptional regulator YdaS (Cro superfamily)